VKECTEAEREMRRATGTFPRIPEKGGREEADSGSDGGQEQIQEEGKWMGCLVCGLNSFSHSGNDPVITAHCLKEALLHEHKRGIKRAGNVSERLYGSIPLYQTEKVENL